MKKIWKTRKEEEGVSPVIATILMVAITVVLAAVLYVMVVGLGGGPPPTPPVGTWIDVGAESSTQGILVFGSFSYDVKPIELKLIVKADGIDAGKITIPSNTGASPQNLTWTDAPAGAYATYYDYSPDGGLINQGDKITLYGLSPGTSYSFEVYHNPTEGICSMTGQSDRFTTP